MQQEWTSNAFVCLTLRFLMENVSIPHSSHRMSHSRCSINHLPSTGVDMWPRPGQSWYLLCLCGLSKHVTSRSKQTSLRFDVQMLREKEQVSFFWMINCKEIGIKLSGISRKNIKPTCKENQRWELVRESPDSTTWVPKSSCTLGFTSGIRQFMLT